MFDGRREPDAAGRAAALQAGDAAPELQAGRRRALEGDELVTADELDVIPYDQRPYLFGLTEGKDSRRRP